MKPVSFRRYFRHVLVAFSSLFVVGVTVFAAQAASYSIDLASALGLPASTVITVDGGWIETPSLVVGTATGGGVLFANGTLTSETGTLDIGAPVVDVQGEFVNSAISADNAEKPVRVNDDLKVTGSVTASNLYSKSEVDALIGDVDGSETDLSGYYTKTEADARYYTKSVLDASLADKLDSSSAFTQTDADARYYTKTAADARYYTQSQVDAEIAAAVGTSATAATGVIELDGVGTTNFIGYDETIRIQDGVGGDVTYTVVNFAGGFTTRVDANNVNLDLGGGIGDDGRRVAGELAYAISLSRLAGDLAIDAAPRNLTFYSSMGSSVPISDPVVDLTNTATGTAGNIAITATNNDGEFVITGMSGGTN
ncbi:MAG: hypothetical protein KC925_00955 [Candidatus Doudnabacteria bacterium]|nr:hypothetical protein [Candidatus Doudnabacteria bacterium]MCA9387967.1 hypothetical protein [Candidatus Andersenbacteria bacterium]